MNNNNDIILIKKLKFITIHKLYNINKFDKSNNYF